MRDNGENALYASICVLAHTLKVNKVDEFKGYSSDSKVSITVGNLNQIVLDEVVFVHEYQTSHEEAFERMNIPFPKPTQVKLFVGFLSEVVVNTMFLDCDKPITYICNISDDKYLIINGKNDDYDRIVEVKKI